MEQQNKLEHGGMKEQPGSRKGPGTGEKPEIREQLETAGSRTGKAFDEPDQENRRKKKMEAGFGSDGEPSAEAVKRWLLWSALALGICLAAACILGAVSMAQNRKPAVLLTVDGQESSELVLNRKGDVLGTGGNPGLRGLTLPEWCERILEELYGEHLLEEQEAAVFTVRLAEGTVRADTEQMAERIAVAAEAFLKNRQAKGTVYVGNIMDPEAVMKLAGETGCSTGKAALVLDLLKRNVRVKSSDRQRLCAMSPGELSREIGRENYTTSFLVVKAGKLYQVKKEETSAPETEETEPEERMTEENGSGGGEEERPDRGTGGSGKVKKESKNPAVSGTPETEAENRENSGEPETSAPETKEPETAVQETEEPETSAPETEEPETAVQETEEPETSAPETEESETVVQETSASGTSASPETESAETSAPETAAPGSLTPVRPTAPETSAPPETTAPPETEPVPTEPHTVGPGILEDVVPVN